MNVLRALAPLIIVLGFYPLALKIAEIFSGPDIPFLIMFVWSLALAVAVLKMYRNLRSKA